MNVRVHSFENNRPSFSFSTDFDDLINEDIDIEEEDVELEDPIRVHTVIADAYYLFNGKRFSYAAAYDQSVIQKKSAGSIMAGAMFYYGKIDYATKNNAELIYLMRGLGKVKLWQGSVGAGYAYNWVPVKGLLVNAMAMPMAPPPSSSCSIMACGMRPESTIPASAVSTSLFPAVSENLIPF